MTSLHSSLSDAETASRPHGWQRPAPPSLDTARRSVLLHKSTSTHALPELSTPPPSAAAAARAVMQQKIKAKLIAQKGIGTNTLKKRPEDSVSVHRRINQDVVDAAGAAMRASINQMFSTARLSASANAIRSALTRSLTMETQLPHAPMTTSSSEPVTAHSMNVPEAVTESNFALVPHQVSSPARSPQKSSSHHNTTPKPFALTPKAASPSRPTYTESCRPAPVLLYRPPSPPTLGRPAFRVSKGKLTTKREAQRLLAIVNAQAEEVAIRQQQQQMQLSIRPQTVSSTTASREATFSRLQRPKSALPASSHLDTNATSDKSSASMTATNKPSRARPASASAVSTPHVVEHARVLHHSPSLRNLTVPKLPLQDITHNDSISQSSLSPASCSSDSSIEEEEFEVEIDIDIAAQRSEFEQEPLSLPSGVQPIELPFDSAVLELAFQYMKHAQQCNSCPPLFATTQSARRASECVCWSLPDTFAHPQSLNVAVRTERRKMTRTAYEAYLTHRQQTHAAQTSMSWWTPAVQLVMCADYLDLPGLARIAGTRLATAFQTDAKFVAYLQSSSPHFALSFLPSLPADEFIDLIINYAPLTAAFINQTLPELESILRSVYLVNLARRHREREDQLDKMLLDLTAVETFPPLLANADKPDATTGKYWQEHCDIFRRFVSMLTQSKSASVPAPLSDQDLIECPAAVLHLFGASKAIDVCLMSLLDRMHQLTTLNLHGCTSLTEETICAIIARTPLVQSASFPYVANCGARALSEMGRSWPALELLDITSCTAIDDVALETFVTACSAQFGTDRHPLKYLNVANIGTITDRSLKCIGRYFALHDLCLYGCYRVTDNGVLDLRVDCLKRFNFSGCYKITSGCQRYLFTSNTNILFYNAPHQFGPAGVPKKQ